MDRGTQHTLTTPRHKYVKLTTLSLNHTSETRVLTRSLYVWNLARAINFPKRSLYVSRKWFNYSSNCLSSSSSRKFIITAHFTSLPHCLKLRVSHWSAEFQFQRDANAAGAHEPSILRQEHSPELRRPECYADNSHPSNAEIKIFWDACCHVTPTHTRSGIDNRSPPPVTQ